MVWSRTTKLRTWPMLIFGCVALLLAVTGCSGADSVIPTSTASSSGFIEDETPTPVPPEAAEQFATASDPVSSVAGFRPGVDPASVGPENGLLQVRLQGAGQGRLPLVNGGAVNLEEDLVAEIFVDPYPTDTLTAWVDLYLHDGKGTPVTDSKVVIDYDMFSMAHGPFFSLADKSDTGHYVFRLDYIMFGPWGQLLQVQPKGSEEQHKIEVTIVAIPS